MFIRINRTIAFVLALGLCLLNLTPTVQGQNAGNPRFKVGDLVEVFSAGDAQHGVIVGGYQETDFGYGTYQVHLEGEKNCNNHVLDTRYNAKFVQPRFQADSGTKFKAGQSVQVRRYDGATYKGSIVGIDVAKYQVRYTRNGTVSSEWFHVNNVRAANAVKPAQNNKGGSTPAPKTTAHTAGPWQKFKIGDRVLYHDLGFLTPARYGTIIAVDVDKRLYTVRDEKDASSRYSYPCYAVIAPNAKLSSDFFIGKWDVRIVGATSTFERDGDLYRRYSGGMQLPPLEINANGTYVWRDLGGKTVRGNWKPRQGVPGITLLKALQGRDYTLYQKTEAYATTNKTQDQIGLHHIPSKTGYYEAYRIGPNKSCVLTDRFK